MSKFIIVSGDTTHVTEKGRICSAIGTILQSKGINVTFLKIEQYLNHGNGKLSPEEHGEIYVLGDGTESDLSLGEFERTCMVKLTKDNFITFGKIFYDVITSEMRGDNFDGYSIEMNRVFHKELKKRMLKLSTTPIQTFKKGKYISVVPDVVIVAIGGSLYDDRTNLLVETLQTFSYKFNKEDFCFISLDYLVTIESMQKTKNIQRNLNYLRNFGLKTDVFFYKSESEQMSEASIKILGNHCKLQSDCIFRYPSSNNTEESVWEMANTEVGSKIIQTLHLQTRDNIGFDIEEWRKSLRVPKEKTMKIGIISRHPPNKEPYYSLEVALRSIGKNQDIDIEIVYINPFLGEKDENLGEVKGIICPGGFQNVALEGKLELIKYVRMNNIPFVGICLGFQLGIIEFCRNVLNIKKATSSEFDPKTKHPVIHKLVPSETEPNDFYLGLYPVKYTGKMKEIYESDEKKQIFRHGYGLNPEIVPKISEKNFKVLGYSTDERPSAFQYEDHPFFVGVQYHPELSYCPGSDDLLFSAFLKASAEEK